MKNILFVCIHNSARSQMAEAFLNDYGRGGFTAQSAGIEKGTLSPLVVKAMSEAGIDISKNRAKEVSGFIKDGRAFDAVITVCDAASAERCPVFPGKAKRLAWSFPDPSAFSGTDDEKMEKIRQVRERIKDKVMEFVAEAGGDRYWI